MEVADVGVDGERFPPSFAATPSGIAKASTRAAFLVIQFSGSSS